MLLPETRNSIDIKWPITVFEGLDWKKETERLASEMASTAFLMAQYIDQDLPEGYTITARGTDLSLLSRNGSNTSNSIVQLGNDSEHLRMTVWRGARHIEVRDVQFTVRQKQYWVLWNYHAAKKKQGYSEVDFPGNLWQPDYREVFEVTDGAYAGQDVVDLISGMDRVVEDLQSVTVEESHEPLWVKSYWQNHDRDVAIHKRVAKEVYEATGITCHGTFGLNVLAESHEVLQAVQRLLEGTD